MSPHKLLRYTLFGLVAFVALAAEPTPPPCDAEPVKVSVLAILATEKDEPIDKRVACIAREVQKVDPKLKGFQVHKIMCNSVAVGGKLNFELIDDQKVNVTVEQGADKENRVQLKIEPPLLGEITYQTACGKFLPIITRYQTKDGRLLILAVRVQPCPGK